MNDRWTSRPSPRGWNIKVPNGPQKFEKVPAWASEIRIDSNDRIGIINNNNNNKTAYPAILPELDRPVGPVDAEGPAPRRGADGVAGLEAPSHSEGGFRGARLLEGDAVDGKLAGGGERKRGEGNASYLHDGWRMWVLLLRSCYGPVYCPMDLARLVGDCCGLWGCVACLLLVVFRFRVFEAGLKEGKNWKFLKAAAGRVRCETSRCSIFKREANSPFDFRVLFHKGNTPN